MSARQYQYQLSASLSRKLMHPFVVEEWAAFTGNVHQYAPRVDVALGPFSTTPGKTKEDEYNNLVLQPAINDFLRQVFDFHMANVFSMNIPAERMEIEFNHFENVIYKNQNARCLIAIEIENTSSKKHIMGSLVNAASLGRVGIGIAYTESVKRTFVRILNYLAFLTRVEKNSYDATNFLIITKEQMDSIVSSLE